jgi:hypothetical protein
VKVRSTPDSPFLYDLRFDEDGAVADTLAYEVRHQDVATIESSYRSDVRGRDASEVNASFAPWQDFSFDANRLFRIPAERTEYVTARTDLLWLKTVYGYEVHADGISFGRPMRDRLRSYAGDDAFRDTWFGAPSLPEPRHELTAQERVAIPCSACRDADELFFWIEDLGDSARGHYGAFDTRWENSATRLYRNGELVVSRRTGRGALATVPEDADYRLEIDSWSDAPWSLGTRTTTAWTFRSAAPTGNSNLPPWYACASGRGRDCAFLPLLFAEYDVPLDPLNRAPSEPTLRLEIGIHGQAFAPAPEIRDVGVDVSYDDGISWQQASVRKLGPDGRYLVVAERPLDAPFVSLRLDAQAAAGGRLTQQIIRAYRLG